MVEFSTISLRHNHFNKTRKVMKTITVESAEFRLSDSTSVVWHKEPTKWGINIYKHAHYGRYISASGRLPNIDNARYLAKTYPLMPVKQD